MTTPSAATARASPDGSKTMAGARSARPASRSRAVSFRVTRSLSLGATAKCASRASPAERASGHIIGGLRGARSGANGLRSRGARGRRLRGRTKRGTGNRGARRARRATHLRRSLPHARPGPGGRPSCWLRRGGVSFIFTHTNTNTHVFYPQHDASTHAHAHTHAHRCRSHFSWTSQTKCWGRRAAKPGARAGESNTTCWRW